MATPSHYPFLDGIFPITKTIHTSRATSTFRKAPHTVYPCDNCFKRHRKIWTNVSIQHRWQKSTCFPLKREIPLDPGSPGSPFTVESSSLLSHGLGLMSLFGDVFYITFNYVLEIISPIVGWCETLGHLPTPVSCGLRTKFNSIYRKKWIWFVIHLVLLSI